MERQKYHQIAFLMLLFLAFVPLATAQQGVQDGTAGTGTTNKDNSDVLDKTTVVPMPDDTTIPELPPPLAPPSNIFISGKVIKEDGTPPPLGATIEMDCGNSLTRRASASNDGHFSFPVEGNKNYGGVMPDATAGYGSDVFHTGTGPDDDADRDRGYSSRVLQAPVEIRMMGCDIRAQLPGYRSSILTVREVLQPGENDLGTIVVYPLERVQGRTVSVTTLRVPKKARKLLKQAKKALKKEKLEEAEIRLKSAVNAYPKFAEAWFELGQLYRLQHRDEEAEDAYMNAIEVDKLYVNPYIGLGWLLCIEQKWKEAASYTGQALNLEPLRFPEAHFLNALANFNINNLEIAEKSARQYQRLDQEPIPQVFLILAHIYAMRGDDAGSIAELRDYLKYAPDAPDAEEIRSLLREKLAKSAMD